MKLADDGRKKADTQPAELWEVPAQYLRAIGIAFAIFCSRGSCSRTGVTSVSPLAFPWPLSTVSLTPPMAMPTLPVCAALNPLAMTDQCSSERGCAGTHLHLIGRRPAGSIFRSDATPELPPLHAHLIPVPPCRNVQVRALYARSVPWDPEATPLQPID